MANWVKACSSTDVEPGSMREFDVADERVLVIRGRSRIIATPPTCPHMATPLIEGFFDGETLTCAKHLWQWLIDEGGKPIGEADSELLQYSVKEEAGVVYVNMENVLRYHYE